jgi:hypothetical protein
MLSVDCVFCFIVFSSAFSYHLFPFFIPPFTDFSFPLFSLSSLVDSVYSFLEPKLFFPIESADKLFNICALLYGQINCSSKSAAHHTLLLSILQKSKFLFLRKYRNVDRRSFLSIYRRTDICCQIAVHSIRIRQFHVYENSPLFLYREKFRIGTAEIETPMMNSLQNVTYARDEKLNYDTISLPFKGGEYAMSIHLLDQQPGDVGSLARLCFELAKDNISTDGGPRVPVDLKIPKMKFSSKNSILRALNVKKNLRSSSDSDVIHATSLEMDEKGTVAAGATAIEMASTVRSKPVKFHVPFKFHVNRPFLMRIVHSHTIVKPII